MLHLLPYWHSDPRKKLGGRGDCREPGQGELDHPGTSCCSRVAGMLAV